MRPYCGWGPQGNDSPNPMPLHGAGCMQGEGMRRLHAPRAPRRRLSAPCRLDQAAAGHRQAHAPRTKPVGVLVHVDSQRGWRQGRRRAASGRPGWPACGAIGGSLSKAARLGRAMCGGRPQTHARAHLAGQGGGLHCGGGGLGRVGAGKGLGRGGQRSCEFVRGQEPPPMWWPVGSARAARVT